MSPRKADWEHRLTEVVAKAETRPFQWGRHDCCAFAARCVKAQTGDDFFAPFRGKYRSGAGSIRALREHGAGTVEATFTAALGDPVPVLRAKRGDIVFDGEAVGLMWQGHALFVGQEGDRPGLVRVPLSKLVHAWRVGA